jgi:hypothetical protein
MPNQLPDSDGGLFSPHPIGSPCGFAETTFALPTVTGASSPALGALSGQTTCTSGTGALAWELVDLNGDGLVDLVVTSTCDDATVGRTGLLVYPNTGTGFGPAVRFALPAIAQTAGCASFALVDVDGDLLLDLVATSLCTDPTVGTSQWLVFKNVGGSFATAAASLPLPPGAAAGAYPSVEVDAPTCTAGKPAFAFYDLTADGKPDLVVTTACDDASVGVSHWRVYPGTGAGFGPAISFGLPGAGDFYAPLAGAMQCQGTLAAPAYALVDFDGDFLPDLVVTQSCADSAAGTSHWLVYPNQKTAFATSPTIVALPGFAGAPERAYGAVSGTTPCTNGSLGYALVDFDGDLKADLVVTSACGDAQTGVNQWLVYPGNGTAFTGPKSYGLPAALGATTKSPAASLTGSIACGTPATAFDVARLVGAPLDLAVTASCSDPGAGVSRWLVFAPECP